MFVITRHRPVGEGTVEALLEQGQVALNLLGERPGFVRGWVARAADDRALVMLATEWRDVGSWRRAMSPVDVRLVVMPFMTTAIDEPTAFLVAHAVGDAVVDGEV